MSFFGVTLRAIEKVWKHPNADRLDLAQINGMTYQFVVGRDEYKVGDEVLYFPVDAILPDWVMERMGLKGKLSGSAKNRIKTVKLRAEISQGIVCRPEVVMGVCTEKPWRTMSPEDLTQMLGVTKYEPPAVFCKAGKLIHMPDGVPVYDIEGADGNPEIVAILMDRKVSIMEKAEGSNFWYSMAPTLLKEEGAISWYEFGEQSVGTHYHEIKPIEGIEHDFWKVAKDQLDGFLRFLACEKFRGKRVTLRGEYCGPGVQKNIYKLASGKVFVFDILVDGNYLPPAEFIELHKEWAGDNAIGDQTPPLLAHDVILREWINNRTIREASNGKSLLNPSILREGIVIKPMVEEDVPKFGRLILKQRSPEYLAQSDF